MVNLFTNAGFADGLTGWTHSDGVEAITIAIDEEPDGATSPGVRLPGAGYLGQRLPEGCTVTGNHLYFFASPLDSTGFRLQIRLDYTDGSHDTHESHAITDFELPMFKRLNAPLDRNRQLRQVGINNMDFRAGGAVFLTMMFIDGELAAGDGMEGGEPFYGRKMAGMSARMMDARFFELEHKLEEILDRLPDKGPAPELKKVSKVKTG